MTFYPIAEKALQEWFTTLSERNVHGYLHCMVSGRVNAKIQRSGHCFAIPLKVRRFDPNTLHFQSDVHGALFPCKDFHPGRRVF